MKKCFLYGLMMILIISGMSCSKFLTKEVQGSYPADQFYQTSDQAVVAINAAINRWLHQKQADPPGFGCCFGMQQGGLAEMKQILAQIYYAHKQTFAGGFLKELRAVTWYWPTCLPLIWMRRSNPGYWPKRGSFVPGIILR
jgi:hypothetical protein